LGGIVEISNGGSCVGVSQSCVALPPLGERMGLRWGGGEAKGLKEILFSFLLVPKSYCVATPHSVSLPFSFPSSFLFTFVRLFTSLNKSSYYTTHTALFPSIPPTNRIFTPSSSLIPFREDEGMDGSAHTHEEKKKDFSSFSFFFIFFSYFHPPLSVLSIGISLISWRRDSQGNESSHSLSDVYPKVSLLGTNESTVLKLYQIFGKTTKTFRQFLIFSNFILTFF
jgi:hypothetical protein